MRADLALVEAGLCDTRSQAQLLIKAGEVFFKGATEPLRKSSTDISIPELLEVRRQAPQFVSRGGLKLWHALADVGIGVEGYKCLDFGQSTGGFTDCLLYNGAAHVVGFDVGHGQLHERLRTNNRVTAFEGVNLKGLNTEKWLESSREAANIQNTSDGFDLAVADLSFISLFKVLPSLIPFFSSKTQGLFLLKPQFELGADALDKRGIIRPEIAPLEILSDNMDQACLDFGLRMNALLPCKVRGGDGNQEFFVHLTCYQ